MAILFLGERFQFFHAAGIVLILVGIILATQTRKNQVAIGPSIGRQRI